MWGTKIKDLPFYLVVKGKQEIWRAADFWIKEPETIAWINSFTEDDIFFDIGANVGVFSLYAAHRRILTQSFEPERLNLISLDLNRHIYGYTGNDISRWFYKNNAVSDIDGKSTFYVHHSGPGNSGGQVGAAVDESGREFKPVESYEVETYKIDTLAGRLGVPNHIKIDVDGHEWRILQGAAHTLGNPELKSVLVEVNNCYADIDGYMKSFGFTDFNRFNGADINRRAGQKSRNVIYLRQNS
jgi:FkbM family methyltransferase